MNPLPPTGTEWVQALGAVALQTPAYVYSIDALAAQMRALQEALGTPLLAVVAACNNPDVLARLPEDVRFGARCASRFEMNIVAAWKSEHLYVGMPALDAASARAVLGGRYKLVIDAPSQLETLVQLRGARHITPVTLSLSATLAGSEPTACRQGMDADALEQALVLAQRHAVPVGGLHLYAGRHAFGRLGLRVARTLQEAVTAVEARLGYPLQTVNLGGGLEEDWASRGHDFAAYRHALRAFPSHLQLMHEPGRSALASAGVFVTRVVGTKSVRGQCVAICDGGLVQAHALTRADRHWRAALPLVREEGVYRRCRAADAPGTGTLVSGASAGEEDLFTQVGDTLASGDLLAFTEAGAYAQSRTPAHYLGYPPAHAYVRP